MSVAYWAHPLSRYIDIDIQNGNMHQNIYSYPCPVYLRDRSGDIFRRSKRQTGHRRRTSDEDSEIKECSCSPRPPMSHCGRDPKKGCLQHLQGIRGQNFAPFRCSLGPGEKRCRYRRTNAPVHPNTASCRRDDRIPRRAQEVGMGKNFFQSDKV